MQNLERARREGERQAAEWKASQAPQTPEEKLVEIWRNTEANVRLFLYENCGAVRSLIEDLRRMKFETEERYDDKNRKYILDRTSSRLANRRKDPRLATLPYFELEKELEKELNIVKDHFALSDFSLFWRIPELGTIRMTAESSDHNTLTDYHLYIEMFYPDLRSGPEGYDNPGSSLVIQTFDLSATPQQAAGVRQALTKLFYEPVKARSAERARQQAIEKAQNKSGKRGLFGRR